MWKDFSHLFDIDLSLLTSISAILWSGRLYKGNSNSFRPYLWSRRGEFMSIYPHTTTHPDSTHVRLMQHWEGTNLLTYGLHLILSTEFSSMDMSREGQTMKESPIASLLSWLPTSCLQPQVFLNLISLTPVFQKPQTYSPNWPMFWNFRKVIAFTKIF